MLYWRKTVVNLPLFMGGEERMEVTAERVLETGRLFMLDAQKCEMEEDYLTADSLYSVCCEMFSEIMKGNTLQEAKGEYMHALVCRAALPQIAAETKNLYLQEASTLAQELEQETGDIEYTIALGCIQDELLELSKALSKQCQFV